MRKRKKNRDGILSSAFLLSITPYCDEVDIHRLKEDKCFFFFIKIFDLFSTHREEVLHSELSKP